MRSLDQRAVQLLDRGENRQDHQGQIAVDHPHQHRAIVEQEAVDARGQASRDQRLFDHPVIAKDHQPGIDPHDHRHPERQRDQIDQRRLHRAGLAGDVIGHGQADPHADQRGHRRQPQRAGDDVKVLRIELQLVGPAKLIEDLDVRLATQRPVKAAIGPACGEGHGDDDANRDDQGKAHDDPGGQQPPDAEIRPHAPSTLPESCRKPKRTSRPISKLWLCEMALRFDTRNSVPPTSTV